MLVLKLSLMQNYIWSIEHEKPYLPIYLSTYLSRCGSGVVIKNYDSTSAEPDLIVLPKSWKHSKVRDQQTESPIFNCKCSYIYLFFVLCSLCFISISKLIKLIVSLRNAVLFLNKVVLFAFEVWAKFVE